MTVHHASLTKAIEELKLVEGWKIFTCWVLFVTNKCSQLLGITPLPLKN